MYVLLKLQYLSMADQAYLVRSIAHDVVADALSSPHFEKLKQWAQFAKSGGIPRVVQLAHPGRMSPNGNQPTSGHTSPSVPLTLGEK
jgi:hypothetical protein